MSYQKRVDDMVGTHVAEFQAELSLARKLQGHEYVPAMPYGYPLAVYRPMHLCRIPQVKQFIAQTGGKLSNGVPKVLRHELVEGYILGIYNPQTY